MKSLILTVDNGQPGLVEIPRPTVLEDPYCYHGEDEQKGVQQDVQAVNTMSGERLFVKNNVRAG